MEPVVLRTERLQLSMPTSADIEAMTAYCQDPEIARFVPIRQPYTEGSARFFIERLVPDHWASGADYNWAIRATGEVTDAAGGRLLGMVGATPAADGSVHVGYWLGAAHRGHGYAPEAAGEVIRWAKESLGTQTFSWWAVAGNTSSRRVAEKLGFTPTGTHPIEGGFRGEPAEGWFAELRTTP